MQVVSLRQVEGNETISILKGNVIIFNLQTILPAVKPVILIGLYCLNLK